MTVIPIRLSYNITILLFLFEYICLSYNITMTVIHMFTLQYNNDCYSYSNTYVYLTI